MFISYDQWMRGTKLGLTKPRSKMLKQVDLALEQYDLLRTKKQSSYLRTCFNTWKLSKGVEWEESKRNNKNMVTDLDKMLSQSDLLLSPMDVILEEQRALLQNLFRERKLHSRSLFGLKTKKKAQIAFKLQRIADGATAAKDAISGAASGGSDEGSMKAAVLSLVSELFNNIGPIAEIQEEIAAELGAGFLSEMIAEMVPYAGVLRSGYNVIDNWKKTAKNAYANHKVNKYEDVAKAGDPRKAVLAIEQCLERQVNHYLTKASRSTISFSAKIAVHATGAGGIGDPLIGGVSAMASLVQLIYEIGRDYQEKRAINKIINSGQPLNHRVFDVCPLLGAYYIVCTNTSDILDILNEDIGSADWLNDVEDLAKKLEKIKKPARKVIDKHRYYFDNMPNLKMSSEMMKKRGIKISKKDKLKFYLSQKKASLPM